MGLDLVEFAIIVEDALDLQIPNRDWGELRTPRQLIDYLTVRLPCASDGYCLSQRAFYQLRQALGHRVPTTAARWRPATQRAELFPQGTHDPHWQGVRQDLGAQYWPRIGCRGWFERPLSPRLETLGEAAEFLATYNPLA